MKHKNISCHYLILKVSWYSGPFITAIYLLEVNLFKCWKSHPVDLRRSFNCYNRENSKRTLLFVVTWCQSIKAVDEVTNEQGMDVPKGFTLGRACDFCWLFLN